MSEKRNADQQMLYGFPREAFDRSKLLDVDRDFLDPEDLAAFQRALQAPDPLQSPSGDDLGSLRSPRSASSVEITRRVSNAEDELAAALGPAGSSEHLTPTPTQGTFITAQNDWAPVSPMMYRHKRGSRKGRRAGAKGAVAGLLGTRTKDETREGYLYQLSKWPLLLFIFAWMTGLGIAYLSTRIYIWVYEHFFTWRGERENLRRKMRRTSNYKDWIAAAKELDAFLGGQAWREQNSYAYYDSKTVRRVWAQMRKTRIKAEEQEASGDGDGGKLVDDLRLLAEACVKNDFVGVENPRLYSQTYYGTKNLVQNFVDESK